MNDAEYEAQRARLQELADRWINIGLGWWRITNSYDRTGEHFAGEATVEGNYHGGVVARCYPDWRYMEATVIWNMPEVMEIDDEKLEIFVHELMHVFLSEVVPEDGERVVRDHEERVASTLAKGFIWARNAAVAGSLGASTDDDLDEDTSATTSTALSSHA